MKYVKLFENWLKEDKGTHDFGCAMLYLSFPELKDIQSKIEEDDIFNGEEDDDRSYGLEDKPHVTLLYGLHDDEIDSKEVMKICKSVEYPDLRLHDISLFEKEKYDVIKFEVDCENDALTETNRALSKLPNSNEYPKYAPHVTVAYVKAGKGEKYVKMFKDTEYTAKPISIVYSPPEGDKVKSDL